MSNKLYEENDIRAIADAIRAKGVSGTMTVAQMPSKVAAITAKETVTWHQCPEAVRNYLAYLSEHPYLPSDYSTSVIETYYGDDANNSKPIGKIVDGVTYYNEVPNIETPFSSENAAGTLTPLDRIRWIKAYNAWSYDVRNCRDLGGWSCDGGTVKYGKLFRSGDVSSQSGAVLVGELGVGAELDLDQDHLEEKSKLGNILYHGATANIQYSLANKEAWKDILGFVFYCVLNNIVLDFHCAVGCDRTGTLAVIIEAILGVSQSDIDTDYEMSSFAGASWLRKRNGTAYPNFISQINALPVGTTFRDKVINWVASLGFTASEINAFRAELIDGNPETVTPVIDTFDVTKSGSNITFSNPSATTEQYQPYLCDITPDDGYVIESVVVTVNGVDMTNEYLTGDYIEVGTKDIVSNGITDVTGYANAQVSDVNLVSGNIKNGVSILGVVGSYAGGGTSVNCRIFTFTSASAVANQNVTVVSGNADVAAHYTDANAMITVRKMTNNNSNGLSFLMNTNHNMGGGKYGVYVNCNTTSNNAGTIATSLSTASSSAISVYANVNGDIIVHCNSSQNNFGGADYIITFSW